jgi:hypothetical protein
MQFLYIILGFLIFSCEKEKLPESKKISITGLYVFKKITITIIDNSTQKGSAYYENGMTFINQNEVNGLDTIITDFSLIKIKNNKIFFNAEITNTDTIWKTTYDCVYSNLYSFHGGQITFYPIGSKRDCYVESINGKDFVINPPLIWPYASNGPAYSLIYLLQKINE